MISLIFIGTKDDMSTMFSLYEKEYLIKIENKRKTEITLEML